MSEIVQSQMSEHEARRATERIRLALDRVSTAWADLAERVTEAYQRRADLALGYESWAADADAELRPPEGLAIDVRRELVGLLSAAGMPTRAIAPVAGVSHMQVGRDAQVERNVPPEPPSQVDIRREAVLQRNTEGASTRQIAEDLGISHMTVSRDLHAAHSETDLHLADPCEPVRLASDATIGLDGKTYKKPAAAAPRRRPLADGWRDATLDLSKLIERIERLTADDRFPSSKDEIARYANDLIRARDALAGVIEQFN